MDQQWKRDCSEAIHQVQLSVRYLAMSDGGGTSILVLLDLSLGFTTSQPQYPLGTGGGEHYLTVVCFFSLGLISTSVGWRGEISSYAFPLWGPLCAIKLLFSPNDHVDIRALEDFTHSSFFFNIYSIWNFWIRSSTALGFGLISTGSPRGTTALLRLFEVMNAPQKCTYNRGSKLWPTRSLCSHVTWIQSFLK